MSGGGNNQKPYYTDLNLQNSVHSNLTSFAFDIRQFYGIGPTYPKKT